LLMCLIPGSWFMRVWAADLASPRFIDLSLLVAPDFPCSWPGAGPGFQINHYQRIGPRSAYNTDILALDDDKVPAWQFVGEACVIDNRPLLDTAPKGHSPLILAKHVKAWEKRNRPFRFGDVVLFYSGFSDRYYQSLPLGRSFIADPLEAKTPGWPDPAPECMEYLATRKVMTLGTDSPSMGPIPGAIAEESHFAGLKHGMIWTEGATQLGELPSTGAFYCTVGLKHAKGIGAEARAFAIVGQPLAQQLIKSAREKRVVDLSVLLAEDRPVWWPGRGLGNNRHPYLRTVVPPYDMNFHLLDSHTGTHLVPPSYALPSDGFENQHYASEVRKWLTAYEKKYGRRGNSSVTTSRASMTRG